MTYDLQRLGPLGFQDAAAALVIAQFGPVVRRLGRGKDGGRDMEARGVVVWSGTPEKPGEAWDGHTVFQVKHRERPLGTKADAQWLWDQIRNELNEWANPDSNRLEVPKYLVFVSNVRLSPDPVDGGLAYVEEKISGFFTELNDRSLDDGPGRYERQTRRQRLQPLKKWRLIDGNQVDSWFDIHDGVRRAYDGFLTTGDVLADLVALRADLPAKDLEPALQIHARNSLVRDRNIYFDEAGGDGGGVPLDRIVVDLPVRVRSTNEAARAVQYVLDRGEHALKPSIATLPKPRHIVLTGAPGNGKTTITRFLVQAYRAAMLADANNLGDDHRAVIDGTAEKLRLLKRALPSHRRWAVRVDLAEFAKRFVAGGRQSLLAWIAEDLTAQGYTRKLEPWLLKEWMNTWPWFVALDGLDEVSEPAVRKWVIGAVHEFVADAEADDSDVFVLVTTRPSGYVDEMSAEQFDRIDLTDLQTAEALAYGHLVTQIRLRNDSARIARVDGILPAAEDLWASLPGRRPGVDERDRPITSLSAQAATIESSLSGRKAWPGQGPTNPRVDQMTQTLLNAAALVRRYGAEIPHEQTEAHRDLEAARTRIMHGLYLTAHAANVALHDNGRDRVTDARESGRRVQLAQHHSPYAVAPTGVWVDRMSACENTARSYLTGQFPHALTGEAIRPVDDPGRLAQALANWDIQSHRALARHLAPANVLLITRTQGLIAGASMVLVNAAATAGVLEPSERLVPAIADAGRSWSNLASRWGDLVPPAAHLDEPLARAAAEVRAAYRHITHDTTTLATPEAIAACPELPQATMVSLRAIEAGSELAHVVAEKADTPNLTGPARALSRRAHNDVESGLASPPTEGDVVWVSPADILARRVVTVPQPVADALRSVSTATASAASVAATTAMLARSNDNSHLPPRPNEADTAHQGGHGVTTSSPNHGKPFGEPPGGIDRPAPIGPLR